MTPQEISQIVQAVQDIAKDAGIIAGIVVLAYNTFTAKANKERLDSHSGQLKTLLLNSPSPAQAAAPPAAPALAINNEGLDC